MYLPDIPDWLAVLLGLLTGIGIIASLGGIIYGIYWLVTNLQWV